MGSDDDWGPDTQYFVDIKRDRHDSIPIPLHAGSRKKAEKLRDKLKALLEEHSKESVGLS